MTREPYRVPSNASLEEARAIMHLHDIRHLPVMEDDKLVGIISQGDIRLIQAIPGAVLEDIEVAHVLTPPTCVWGEASLDEVAETMAEQKLDCVVVLGGHGVQGIFTSSDALRALGDVLQRATM